MYVVTGGGSGIGAALAYSLAKKGYRVLVVGRREQALACVAAQSSLIQVCCADVSTAEGRLSVVSALDGVPQLSGLIHNAGVIDPIAPMDTLTQASWHRVMATNLEAPFFLTQALFAKLSKARILCIGSGAAHFPIGGWSLYCMSKAALKMMVDCWQLEYPEMAFASVMPGIVDTPMQACIRESKEGMQPEKHAFFEQLYAEKQLLSPEQVADFLMDIVLNTTDEIFRSKEWDIYEA